MAFYYVTDKRHSQPSNEYGFAGYAFYLIRLVFLCFTAHREL